MRYFKIIILSISLLSSTACKQKIDEKGFDVRIHYASIDTLFKKAAVDTISSPIAGVKLLSYTATHIDSFYKTLFWRSTDSFRDAHIYPSEPNKIEIQFFQFKDSASGSKWTKINDSICFIIFGKNSPEKALLYHDSDFLMNICVEKISMEVLAWTRDYISFSLNDGGYYGGAHGFYASKYFSFELKNGEKLTYEKAFGTASINDLTMIVKPYYEKLYGTSYTQMSDKFILPDCFAFTQLGIKFLYNPYEMGSYADGMREVVVPYSALKGILNPAYKDLK